MDTSSQYPFRDIEAKWRPVMIEERAATTQAGGETPRVESEATATTGGESEPPAAESSPEAPGLAIFAWPAAAGALASPDATGTVGGPTKGVVPETGPREDRPSEDGLAVEDGLPVEDWGLLRRLVAADTHSRFLQHFPQSVRLAVGIDGFDPRASAVARAARIRPEHVVERDRQRVLELVRRLGLRVQGPIVSTSDPEYYAVTQWLFLQLQARGLVRWAVRTCDECAGCGGRFRLGVFSVCPACQGELQRKQIRERRVDLSPYGDRLLGDLDTGDKRGRDRREGGRRDGGRKDGGRRSRKVGGSRRGRGSDGDSGDRPGGDTESVGRRSVWSRTDSRLQRGTLGRVRGCELVFPVSRAFELEYHDLNVFTTRVEMLYGVTFLLVEPYHPILQKILDPAYDEEVVRYRERLKRGSEPRISAIRTGGFALNPLSFKRIPILVSALACVRHCGGAALGIPGHDADHFELARRLQLPIREVVHNDQAKFDHQTRLEEPWLGDGLLTNSGPFCGLPRKVARERIITALGRKGCCQKSTRFRFWSHPISDDSEWGPPVPIVHCEDCGEVPVPETELPLTPDRRRRRVRCPICDSMAQWDPETLRPWLGDSWSFLRLALPHLDGLVEGFRPPKEAGESRAGELEQEEEAGGGPPGPEDAAREASKGTSEAGETGDTGPGPAVEPEILPEDVDIFGVPSSGARDDAESETVDARQEPGGAPVDSEGTEAPAPEEPERSSPTPQETPEPGGGDSPVAEVAPEGSPASESTERHSDPTETAPSAGTRSGQRPRAPERARVAATTSPRREPQDEEDDGRGEVPPWEPSTLKPFESPELRRIPVAMAFCDAQTPVQEVILLRFLTKVLHDLGHVPSHLPFSRCIRVEPVSPAGFSSAQRDQREAPRSPVSRGERPSMSSRRTGHRPPSAAEQAGGGRVRTAHGERRGRSPKGESVDIATAVEEFGADAVRLQVLSCGPLDRHAWVQRDGLWCMRRFLDRVWSQITFRLERGKFISRRMLVAKHRLIDEISRRVSAGKPHTAVAALRRFVKFLESPETAPEEMDRNAIKTFLILLSPFAPFLARELWSRTESVEELAGVPWPEPNEELIDPPEREFVVLVDGRIRDRMVQPSDLEPEKLESRALQRDAIREIVGNREVRKVVVVPRKLVSIVLAPQ